jgi:aminomethyltransferase
MNEFELLQHPPLYALHEELHAKMVAFAGYRMPLQYAQGIIREHLHTRSHAGFFDISHMGQFLLTGSNAGDELERLTPSAIRNLHIGQQRYTIFTNDLGGVIDDIIVTRLAEDRFFIVVNAACKEKDLRHLQTRLAPSCRLQVLSDRALLALQGPETVEVIERCCPEAAALRFMHVRETTIDGAPCIVSRSGYTGEDGFEISLLADNAEALARRLLRDERVQPVGLGARDTLRLEAGLCLYGHELTETITPIEAGLAWLIDKHSNNYPGAKIVQQQLQRGPQRRRIGLLPESKAPVRDGTPLLNRAGNPVGVVTSGGYSPNLGRPVAMGLVKNEEMQTGNTLFVTRHSQQIAVAVAALPFVAHRYNYRGGIQTQS